jgi:hypothetical protein
MESRPSDSTHPSKRLVCMARRTRSDHEARGWRGYRDTSDQDEAPTVFFFCPDCSEREFGH